MPGATGENGGRETADDVTSGLPLSFTADGFTLVILDALRPVTIGRAVHAIDAALRLSAVESRLQWFERWWGREFDWQPAAAPVEDADLTLTPVDDNGDVIGIHLCPRARELPALPNDTDAIANLRWKHVSRRLWLDREPLDADDRQRLAPGALVLLAASFEAAPTAWLECDDGSLRPVRIKGGRVLPGSASESVTGDATDDRPLRGPDSAGWFGCRCEVEVRVDRLRGWADGEALCPAPALGAPVWLELGESASVSRSESDRCWTGRLTRVGDGLGVLLGPSIDGIGGS